MTRPLILIVDDELDSRILMRFFVESWGYRVALAAGGSEALEKAAALNPELVLLDCEMPGMEGRETCHRLKHDPDTAQIPVVMTGPDLVSEKTCDGLEMALEQGLTRGGLAPGPARQQLLVRHGLQIITSRGAGTRVVRVRS